jgi:uncharacterized damage-inducible protein DinB
VYRSVEVYALKRPSAPSAGLLGKRIMRLIARPGPGEYAPYTVEYFQLVPSEDVLQHMEACLRTTPEFFLALPEAVLSDPHMSGEWTVKEILQHITDDERIYAYRTLRFARNDLTELPPFDQEIVSAHSGANERSLASLLDEYATVRKSTLSLFEGLPDEAMTRIGTANGNPMSVRAAAFHIAGHELHHLVSIRTNYRGHRAS